MRPRKRVSRLTVAASLIVIGVIAAALTRDISIRLLGHAELSETVVLVAAFLLLAGAFALDQSRAGVEAASESRTAHILEMALDAVVTMDQDGLITGWNAQAERTFGWARAAVIGRPMPDVLIPPRYRERHQQGLRHFLQTGHGPVMNARIEITALHQSGLEIPIELAISPARCDGARTFSAFIRDISDRHRTAQIQEATYLTAAAANPARDLSELFHSIHQIVGTLMPSKNFYIALTDVATGLISFLYFVDEHDTPPAPKPPGRGLTE